jgi:hypothetical protein
LPVSPVHVLDLAFILPHDRRSDSVPQTQPFGVQFAASMLTLSATIGIATVAMFYTALAWRRVPVVVIGAVGLRTCTDS